MKDIKHAKGSCHDRWHHFSSPARRLDATRIAHKGENIRLAEFQQTKLGEVAVGREILKSMQRSAKVNKSFLLRFRVLVAAESDAFAKFACDVIS